MRNMTISIEFQVLFAIEYRHEKSLQSGKSIFSANFTKRLPGVVFLWGSVLRQPTLTRTEFNIAFLVAIVACIQAGCSSNSHPMAKKLAGNWVMMSANEIEDADGELPVEQATKLKRESHRMDRDVMRSDIMSVSFLRNGRLETKAKQVKQGTWRFVEYDSDEGVVTVTCQLGRDDPVNTKIRFLSDEIICMIPPNIQVLEKEFVFRREK